MASRSRVSHDAAPASERVARLEREVAELRRQLAMIYSQASDRLVVAPPHEEEFLYNEARYRALIELSPQAVWMTDRDGKNNYCNRYWYEFTGMTLESSAGLGWVSALHPEDGPRIQEQWQEAVAKGTGYEAEIRLRRHDGQYRWHLFRVQPLKDANGQVTKWLGVGLDIHDRKAAAAAIARANERMKMAVEAAEAATWDYYPATQTLECCERCLKIFHLPPGTRPTMSLFFSRVHPKDQDRVRCVLAAAFDPSVSGGGEYDIDYRILLPDGTVRWIFAKGTCFFNGEGSREALRFSGLLFDITERKRAERDRASLAAALQNSPDFIGITDLKGRVLFLNRAGQKLVGLRDDAEARSKTAADFFGAAEQSVLFDEILPLVRTGQVWEREFCMRHFVTGEPILVETRVFGIFDQGGRLTSMANLSRDISGKKKTEEQLRLAQKMDAVGRLAGGIAHDFNNLLTIIRGGAEILSERYRENAADLSTVRRIGEAAERATSLTEQLLAFGRRQMVSPRPVDLNRAILRMEPVLQRLVGEGIVLEIRLTEDLEPVNMDPVQFDQILINLAANARDAMPGGGAIALRTFNWRLSQPNRNQTGLKPGRYVCLSFSDTGMGMSQETQHHMFEPFYTTKPGRANGLGLSTVYGIVRQSGGQILVRSAPGEGASFTLYLPRTTEALPPEEGDGTEAGTGWGARTILLVEDESSLRAIVGGHLREQGYTVYEAANAQEALAISSSQQIQLVVTDIVMPGASGHALASALAETDSQMKVIFMSGYADQDALQRALLQPNTIFLQKPFRLRDLMAKIHQAFASRQTKGLPCPEDAN